MGNSGVSEQLIAPPKRASLAIFLVLLLIGLAGTAIILFSADLAGLCTPGDEWLIGRCKRVFANYEPPEHGLLSAHFFAEIGIAFLVAVILGVTFELFMRRREAEEHFKQMAEIEHAGLLSLLGNFVPPEISTEVEHAFYEQVMRSNLVVTYHFSAPPAGLEKAGQTLILVTVTAEYDLINLTKRPHRHLIDHGFEPTLGLGGAHNTFIALQIKEGNEAIVEWPHGPKHEEVILEEGAKGVTKGAKVEVKLKPGTAKGPRPEDALHVLVQHQIVRRSCDQDTWNTWLPADGLKVVAEIDAVAPTLDFHVERISPLSFREDRKANRSEWTLARDFGQIGKVGVLPYQGFTLYWFSAPQGKEPPAAAPVP